MRKARYIVAGIAVAIGMLTSQSAPAATGYAYYYGYNCAFGAGDIPGGVGFALVCNQPQEEVSEVVPSSPFINSADVSFAYIFVSTSSGFDYGYTSGTTSGLVQDPTLTAGVARFSVPSAISTGATLDATLILKGTGDPAAPGTFFYENPISPTQAYGGYSYSRGAEIDTSGVSSISSSTPAGGGALSSSWYALQTLGGFGYVYGTA